MLVCRIVDRPHDDGAPQGPAPKQGQEKEGFHRITGVKAFGAMNLTMNGHTVLSDWISSGSKSTQPAMQAKYPYDYVSDVSGVFVSFRCLLWQILCVTLRCFVIPALKVKRLRSRGAASPRGGVTHAPEAIARIVGNNQRTLIVHRKPHRPSPDVARIGNEARQEVIILAQ